MYFPYVSESASYRQNVTVFGGLNRQLSATDGQFSDMKNMSSKHFPVLSPRSKRRFIKKFKNPQGILDKEDLVLIDDKRFFVNNKEILLKNAKLDDRSPKVLSKMGAVVVIMPDKVWVNVETEEHGYLGNKTLSESAPVTFSLCDATGNPISYQSAEYYETNPPTDGAYMMSEANGKLSLKIYSSSAKTWTYVATTYIQMRFAGAGKGFFANDGITISVSSNKGLEFVFVNKKSDETFSTDTYIASLDNDTITFPGIFNGIPEENISVVIERRVPTLEFVTECQNRLWGCSADGREIYCSKLGDVKNWNSFKGISTDSWAATIGSDGKFTGAITYGDNPLFFKEDSVVKIAISSSGAHLAKETKCRGVQSGSSRSLVVINEMLYYKSPTGICAYNGGNPARISDDLGNSKYTDAVAGAEGDRYYVSMKNDAGEYSLFVYDSLNGIWIREDDTQAIYFCSHVDELYYFDAKDKMLKSVNGSRLYYEEGEEENDIEWFVESVPLGYSLPDQKYISRITMCITVDIGAELDLYMQYNSEGGWTHICNINGKGTKSYTIPLIPRRCNHFKYKICGKGNCKIHSITKTIEEGSED